LAQVEPALIDLGNVSYDFCIDLSMTLDQRAEPLEQVTVRERIQASLARHIPL
jgi:hypothetical protein